MKTANKNYRTLPGVSVVVIGLNADKYLRKSLQSVVNLDYPSKKIEVIYVDSGSTDGSQQIARLFPQVKLLQLDPRNPSAAKGRNTGAYRAKHELIQFVDADSYLHPRWLSQAVLALEEDVAAVSGRLSERHPGKNLFHRMAELEWNLWADPKGAWTTDTMNANVFGGNVLLRKSVLMAVNGYDEYLKAGEDPDLSYRFRKLGFRLLRLNHPMASHDINMQGISQYVRRSRRSGSAYAHLALRYWKESERFMVKRVIRIIGGVMTPIVLIIAGLLSGFPLLGISLAGLIMFRLVFQTGKFSKLFRISYLRALEYSLYLAFSIYPQFLGVKDALMQKFRERNSGSMPNEPDYQLISV